MEGSKLFDNTQALGTSHLVQGQILSLSTSFEFYGKLSIYFIIYKSYIISEGEIPIIELATILGFGFISLLL